MTKFLLGPLGWCYLIMVLDWYPREIVGWNLSLRAKMRNTLGLLF